MNFSKLIGEISKNKKLTPDLMKSETGNNFRAVSEAAILEAINIPLTESKLFYTVEVKSYNLEIREAFGSKGKKLQFIATVHIALHFYEESDEIEAFITEAVGMGIDDCDKAMGKAYTYAVKYALLKFFRLRYSDDPDFEASQPLYTEGATSTARPTPEKKESKGKKEVPMTENQRDYILGMMKSKDVHLGAIIAKFGVNPKVDEFIPMKKAREIIKYLEEYTEEDDDLPF